MSHPRTGWRWMLGAAAGVMAGALLLVGAPAQAADRDPILFQPVTDKDGTFVGAGTGPFATRYPDGVKDDGKTVDRSKVVADNFDKAYTWGSSGNAGGMVQGVVDVTERMNVAGAGINMDKRVK